MEYETSESSCRWTLYIDSPLHKSDRPKQIFNVAPRKFGPGEQHSDESGQRSQEING